MEKTDGVIGLRCQKCKAINPKDSESCSECGYSTLKLTAEVTTEDNYLSQIKEKNEEKYSSVSKKEDILKFKVSYLLSVILVILLYVFLTGPDFTTKGGMKIKQPEFTNNPGPVNPQIKYKETAAFDQPVQPLPANGI